MTDLDEWDRVIKAMTPGPWSEDAVMSEAMHDIILGYQIPNAGSPILVASVYGDDEGGKPGDIDSIQGQRNAHGIAFLRNNAAALVKECRRLREENESLRLVHLEAKELIAEADVNSAIPQPNIDALRSLLCRASRKMNPT